MTAKHYQPGADDDRQHARAGASSLGNKPDETLRKGRRVQAPRNAQVYWPLPFVESDAAIRHEATPNDVRRRTSREGRADGDSASVGRSIGSGAPFARHLSLTLRWHNEPA